MTHHLTKSQIDQLRVVLASCGLDVKPMAKPRKAIGDTGPLTVAKVLAKSKWYKPVSDARLRSGCITTARNLSVSTWEAMLANPKAYGLCFPYRT